MTSGHRLNHAQIGLSETGVAASDYPLLFMKDVESGHFRLVALFGLRPDANCFLINDQWQATYLPLAVLGLPFRLGGSDQSLCIDEESDLVSTDTGSALYSGDGNETAELLRIRSMFDYFPISVLLSPLRLFFILLSSICTGMNDLLLTSRDASIPESSVSGPIYICTRNDDLEAIIEKTPPSRREDLVFLQNGMLSPYLESKGLLMNTQGSMTLCAYSLYLDEIDWSLLEDFFTYINFYS